MFSFRNITTPPVRNYSLEVLRGIKIVFRFYFPETNLLTCIFRFITHYLAPYTHVFISILLNANKNLTKK